MNRQVVAFTFDPSTTRSLEALKDDLDCGRTPPALARFLPDNPRPKAQGPSPQPLVLDEFELRKEDYASMYERIPVEPSVFAQLDTLRRSKKPFEPPVWEMTYAAFTAALEKCRDVALKVALYRELKERQKLNRREERKRFTILRNNEDRKTYAERSRPEGVSLSRLAEALILYSIDTINDSREARAGIKDDGSHEVRPSKDEASHEVRRPSIETVKDSREVRAGIETIKADNSRSREAGIETIKDDGSLAAALERAHSVGVISKGSPRKDVSEGRRKLSNASRREEAPV